MDTLTGLLYLETCKGIESWCLAVEDPQDHTKTRIIKCKGKKAGNTERNFSRKRGGMWKFKAYKFNGRIEKIEIVNRSLHGIWNDLPEDSFRQFQVTELRKLEGWTD